MNVIDAIKGRRSIRKFKQQDVPQKDIETIIDAARYAASGANMQPIKYAVMRNHREVYPCTKWAGYLTDWDPAENERPLCYIAILGDAGIKKTFEPDAGAAVTTMMLAAHEMGLGTCWLGAIDRAKLKEMLGTKHEVLYLLAVGYPAQESRVVDETDGNIKYYEDENGVINVPKRPMSEINVGTRE